MTTRTDPDLAEIRKQVTVPQDPAGAFRLFTDQMRAWWPLASHSIGGEAAVDVTFEPGVGGRILETMRDGETALWGTVTAWDPPARVVFSWHVGREPSEPTEVEVTFLATDTGTRVTLIHRDWARWTDGREMRARYDRGWEPVLAAYADAAVTS